MCCEADVLAHTLDIFHSRSYKQTAEPLEMEQWRQACLSLCLVGLCSLALYLYYVAWWRPQSLRNKLRRQGITGPPPSLLYGNAKEIKSLMAEKSRGGGGEVKGEVKHGFTPAMFPHLEQWKKVYGPVFCYSLGNLVVLHISHPELVKEINLCSSLDLGKTPHLRKTHEPLFGQGILKSSGEVWSHQRKIIAPEFYADKVKGMVDLMVDAATPLLQSWKEKVRLQGGTADMNIDEDLRSYSADVLSRTCFGSNYNRGKEIFTKIRELQKAVSRPNLLAEIVGLRCLPTKRAQEAWRMNREINSLILRTVKEGGNGGEEGRGSSKQSLLQAILRNAGNELTYTDPDSFIVDNCKNMYFAGHETTALTSSWCLMLLALHPEWQARARAEVAEVCADGRPPDAKSIQKMKILTMVIQETLRLYPVGAYVARELRREMEFGGIRIPKGVNIFVQIAALHHDPSIWGPDVLKFNPERFAGGVLGACRFPHAYLPFGLGPRTCLGQHFAMVELKVLLALLLRSFSFSLSPNYRHSPALRLIVEPEFGVDLLVTEL